MNRTQQPYDLIVGLGKSGLSMARFLKASGRTVAATDIDGSKHAEASELKEMGISTQLGFHTQEIFDRASRIIPSPGIPLDMDHILKAAGKGVPVTGELDIFSRHNTTPVIAVTGTNGKTTTTTLIGEMLKSSGLSVFVGGNIGTPLVDYPMAGEKVDLVVAEVSSFQLDLAQSFKPDVALLLNLSPDHLDRYKDYKAYRDSKWGIFKNQTQKDTAILNRELIGFSKRSQYLSSRVLTFSSKIDSGPSLDAQIFKDRITLCPEGKKFNIDSRVLDRLPGIHNRENIGAAALAALACGATPQGITSALSNFTALPHRMSLVREINNVKFYNDSKATNEDAVIRAIESFEQDIILILGGREKNTDFSRLIPAVKARVKQILAIGEAKDNIGQTFENICPVSACSTMARAVQTGFEKASANEVVLLSPACASFDMYENYQARGKDFIGLVNRIKKPAEKGVSNG